MKDNFRACALLVLILLAMTPADGATNLPQKAFNIEGGMIALRSGVMPNTAGPMPPPIGKLKYPTRYFIELVNESPYPVWVDATWTFPEAKKDKPAKPKTFRSTKIPARGSYWIHSDKFGVLVDQAVVVDLHAYSDEKRTNLVGSQTAELLFDQQSVDRFLANFPGAFKNQSSEAKEATLISGWHDIPPPRSDVSGTLADGELQSDIQLSIWKFDSTRRFTCERNVLAASSMDVNDSRIVSRLTDEAQQKARLEQAENNLHGERWTVMSCGEQRIYEVLLSKSQSGGTDVMVLETTEEFKPPVVTPEPTQDQAGS